MASDFSRERSSRPRPTGSRRLLARRRWFASRQPVGRQQQRGFLRRQPQQPRDLVRRDAATQLRQRFSAARGRQAAHARSLVHYRFQPFDAGVEVVVQGVQDLPVAVAFGVFHRYPAPQPKGPAKGAPQQDCGTDLRRDERGEQ